MLKINNDWLKKATITIIVIGEILMLLIYNKYNNHNDLKSILDIVGILIGSIYAYGMFINKSKIMGICSFIFNSITAYAMLKSNLWGLFMIRIYGIVVGIILFFKGKDNYQHESTYKNEIVKILFIGICAVLIYFFNGLDKINYSTLILDLIAVFALSSALFFHKKQSKKQFHFWLLSNTINLILGILKGNIYLIVVFIFWLILDNLSWFSWKLSSKKYN